MRKHDTIDIRQPLPPPNFKHLQNQMIYDSNKSADLRKGTSAGEGERATAHAQTQLT